MRFTPTLLVSLLVGFASLSVSGPVSAHSSAIARRSAAVAPLLACPVAGLSQYIDSWGDARSSGRRHEGVDMAAPGGTPVVAVTAGAAEFKRSKLGGNAIWLVTSSGERFYYAHLDAWAGESRDVQAGELIGFVGQSGNARGNHLHFETRAGAAAVNPYPLVRSACQTAASDDSSLLPVRPLLR